MKNLPKFLILIAVSNFSWLLVSCSDIFYAPTSQNVPLFREKNEIHLTANSISTDQAGGFEGQAAYSITNKFGVIANGAYLAGGSQNESNYGSGYLGEFGAGYFKPFSHNGTFEVFAGGGFGEISYPNRYPGGLRLPFRKYFIQPAVGYSGKFFDIAFSPKIALISYEHRLIYYYEIDAYGNYNSNYAGDRNFIAFEPAVTMRAGWKYTKLQLQIIKSFHDIPQGNNLSASLGLHLMLAPRFKTK